MDTVSYYISRWVAFAITPLLTTAATVAAVKAKAWFGIDLSPAEIVAFVLSLVAPVVVWLYNRGKWEIAMHFGTKTAVDVDAIAQRVVERLPAPPTAPDPGAGSPASPRAPGENT